MTAERIIPYANERWFKLLVQAVDETTVTAVATKLGYKRARISQVINGITIASPDRVAARVLELMDRWSCPYLNTDITAEDCRSVHGGETPSHDPARLAQRRVCRTCSKKETKNELATN